MNGSTQNLISGILLALLLSLTFALLSAESRFGTRKVARLGIFLSLALILGVLESFIPGFFLPGMRLGLANIVLLLVLYIYGFKDGLYVAILKALLVSLLRGSFLSMGGYMALAGTLLSYLGMGLLKALFSRPSPIGVSLFGSLLHVTGQILVAYGFMGQAIFAYYPWLLLLAFFTGIFTGAVALLVMRRARFVTYLKGETKGG